LRSIPTIKKIAKVQNLSKMGWNFVNAKKLMDIVFVMIPAMEIYVSTLTYQQVKSMTLSNSMPNLVFSIEPYGPLEEKGVDSHGDYIKLISTSSFDKDYPKWCVDFIEKLLVL
jgi:hypothetical protein